MILGGTLYLVATPIGNLSDLTARAVKVLKEADVIAAEDTRNTQKLLSMLDIHGKELISYYEHNKRARGEVLAEKLESGLSVALVTDAGTPAISDPGEDIVRLCEERGIPVTAVPGPCAAINALSLSALATGRFAFEGFLTTNMGERKKRLSEIAREKRTMIFYEAPHKLKATLSDLLSTFGDRRITLCREMTKRNEEILRTTLEKAVTLYETVAPRGEYVLVLEGEDALPEESKPKEDTWYASLSHEEHVLAYESRGISRMDAIKAAAKDLGVAKSVLYKELQAK
ncbi:MAG: 16S rRNA (cytidine(1402)-2'-O)-methyltransferase [Ruminococcaceae bacterium]|nr:16S rRNA (cytidine(1402)-2'-O)-methyltransferase [Oscillospiraceae bacterium]